MPFQVSRQISAGVAAIEIIFHVGSTVAYADIGKCRAGVVQAKCPLPTMNALSWNIGCTGNNGSTIAFACK